jgi:hypothetical protein
MVSDNFLSSFPLVRYLERSPNVRLCLAILGCLIIGILLGLTIILAGTKGVNYENDIGDRNLLTPRIPGAVADLSGRST